MTIPNEPDDLQSLLIIIEREQDDGFFHTSNAVYHLEALGETDYITDALRIGIYNLLENILK